MNDRDPMNILMSPGGEEKLPVQSEFYRRVKDIITSSIEAGYQYKQTVVYKNLCDEEELKEWNKLQSNDMVKILDVHNIPAPKSAVLTDAIRVDYVEIKEDTFHIALVKEMSVAGYYIPEYLIAVRPGSVKDVLTGIMDLGVEAQTFFKNEVVKRYRYINVRTIGIEEFEKLLKSIVTSKMYNKIVKVLEVDKPGKKGDSDVKKTRGAAGRRT